MEKNTKKEKGRGKKGVKREFSAGGVVFKKKREKVLWLVRKQAMLPKSSHPKDTWTLPKGWLDEEGEILPGPLTRGDKKAGEEELQKTALREVAEEGGIKAKIIKKIETLRYFFTSTRGRVLKFVTFYLMEYLQDLPEKHDHETEEVNWLPYEQARKKLSYSSERKVLDKAQELLASGMQGNLV